MQEDFHIAEPASIRLADSTPESFDAGSSSPVIVSAVIASAPVLAAPMPASAPVPSSEPVAAVRPARKIVWLYVISIGMMHLLALLAFVPAFFSWTGVIWMALGVHVFGQGITLCYHRLLAHRSFQVPRWLEWSMVTTALCCLEETPARWVSWHRLHHHYSDEPEDPHSPLVNFFWSHFGWLMLHNPVTHDFSIYDNARDLLSDPYYKALEKNRWLPVGVYVAHALVIFGLGYLTGYLAWGPAEAMPLAWSWLVWGVILRTVVMWHVTWSVNSLSHLFGYRNYETADHSRNNWFVALITGGEGWHNNHHHDMSSASNQHFWWEFDVTSYEIFLLAKLGLATNVILPRHVRKASRQG
jgi:fatty-acid desaturase